MLVHLADIPEKRRVNVAERLIRIGAVHGEEAILVRMAAYFPRQNPCLWVPAAEAEKKLR